MTFIFFQDKIVNKEATGMLENSKRASPELGYFECQSNSEKVFIKPNDNFLIGRKQKGDCKIVISSKQVSRIHARVVSTQNQVHIILYSQNSSISINDKIIYSDPLNVHERHYIQDGDKIKIGPEILTFYAIKQLLPRTIEKKNRSDNEELLICASSEEGKVKPY